MAIRYDDDGEDTFTLTTENVSLHNPEDVQAWAFELRLRSDEVILQRSGRKWWCLIDIQGMDVAPSLADAYGALARSFLHTYYLGCVRYGQPMGHQTVATLRHGAEAHRFRSLIYETRAIALLAMAELRKHPPRSVEGIASSAWPADEC